MQSEGFCGNFFEKATRRRLVLVYVVVALIARYSWCFFISRPMVRPWVTMEKITTM